METENSTQVVILTGNLRIEGHINLLPGGRLTDYMNKADKYIAVTNARVVTHDGKELLASPFLNVHQNKIEIILPENNQS